MIMQRVLLGLKGLLLATCAAPGVSWAQDAARSVEPQAQAEEQRTDGDGETADRVIVTSSRLARSDVPTPMLVLDAAVLDEAGRPNVIAALNDLPQFRGSAAPQVGGSLFAGTGNWAPDLRGLGASRTLVLVDGRRMVTGYDNFDYAAIPNLLVERVDIVTGSASAAWGSNAVAGVVNIVLNDDVDGVRAAVSSGLSSYEDAETSRYELAGGQGFADGRGHIVFGAEYIDSRAAGLRTTRPNVGLWQVISNPSYTPSNGQLPLLLSPNVGFGDRSLGGLILTGVNTGQTFEPDGTLRPFNFGTRVGNLSVGGEALGTDSFIQLIAPSTRVNALARVTYEATPQLEISAEVRHSRVFANFQVFQDWAAGNITISRDNAFLPAVVRNQMIAAGETSFRMGRLNADLSPVIVDVDRQTTQLTFAFDYAFDSNWSLDGYYTRGLFEENPDYMSQRVMPRFNQAVDSVISPTTGQPVCRIALTNPNTDCVPINLFGLGAVSEQARAYVTDTSTQRTDVTLDAVALVLRGGITGLWFDDISVALGVEGRREEIEQSAGPLDLAGAFGFFNASAYAGKNTTKEVFSEVVVPVLRDLPMIQSLDLNLAGRLTDDQTGSIESWKVGGLYRVMDGVRLRATRSRDIRAPNLGELYRPLFGPGVNPIFDPQLGITYQPTIGFFNGGNANLEPEVSKTTTAGFTIEPAIIPGLRFDADYFEIRIANAIGTITPQQAINLCSAGNQTLCGAITRGSDQRIMQVSASLINFTEYKTSGIDFSLDYEIPAPLPGSLALRSDLTWTHEFTVDTGLSVQKLVGSQGSVRAAVGVPRVMANAALTYDDSVWGGYVRTRYISEGKFDRTQQIQNNAIPEYFYFDIGAHVDVTPGWGPDWRLSLDVSNLFDKGPPPGSAFSPYYDVIGRYVTLGASVAL